MLAVLSQLNVLITYFPYKLLSLQLANSPIAVVDSRLIDDLVVPVIVLSDTLAPQR